MRNIKQEILLLELQKSNIKTNHILHLILTILTVILPLFGFWIIIWIVSSIFTSIKRTALSIKILKLKQQDKSNDS